MATGRAALLLWAQQATSGYKGVDVKDFSMSFKNGLAFCAIIHHYHPNSINFNALKPDNMLENNRTAFKVAEKLGVPPLLDAEDMIIPKPEPHSVMTYLMQMHSVFVKGQSAGSGGQGFGQNKGNQSAPASSGAKPGGPPPSQNMRQNRGTIAAPNCAGCEKPLRGNVVEFKNKLYHGPCFKCCKCSKVLTACYPVDNLPHCEACARASHSGAKKPNTQQQQNSAPAAKPPPTQNQTQKTPARFGAAAPQTSAAQKSPTPPPATQNHYGASNNTKQTFGSQEAKRGGFNTNAPPKTSQSTVSGPNKNSNPPNQGQALPAANKQGLSKSQSAAQTSRINHQPAASSQQNTTFHKTTSSPGGIGPPGSPSYIKAQQKQQEKQQQNKEPQATPKAKPLARSFSEKPPQHTAPHPSPLSRSYTGANQPHANNQPSYQQQAPALPPQSAAPPPAQQPKTAYQQSPQQPVVVTFLPTPPPQNAPQPAPPPTPAYQQPAPPPTPAYQQPVPPPTPAYQQPAPPPSQYNPMQSYPVQAPALPQANYNPTPQPPPPALPQANRNVVPPLPPPTPAYSQPTPPPSQYNPMQSYPVQAPALPAQAQQTGRPPALPPPVNNYSSPPPPPAVDYNSVPQLPPAIPNYDQNQGLAPPPQNYNVPPPLPPQEDPNSLSASRAKPSNPFASRPTLQKTPTESNDEWEELAPVVPTQSFSFDEYVSSTILQGPLNKRDIKTLGLSVGVKKLWFNLRAERLLYWNKQPTNNDEKSMTPEGVISLRYCQRVEASPSSPVGFKIVLPEREYELEAESPEARIQWLNGLQRAIEIFHKIEHYIGESSGLQTSDLRKEGSLHLRMGIFGWVEHYMILVDGMLLIYLGKGGPRLYKVPIFGISMGPLLPDPNAKTIRFGFTLTTEGGTSYQLSSTDAQIIDEWGQCVTKQKANIEDAINQIAF